MAAWLLDMLEGRFFNGYKIDEVPASLHTYYSVQGFISRILHHHFNDMPETIGLFEIINRLCVPTTVLPHDYKKYAQILHLYIKKSGSWVGDVRSSRWYVNKDCHPCCVLLCKSYNGKELYKFKLIFEGRGAIHVETWKTT